MDPTNTKQKKENELFSIFPSYFHWCMYTTIECNNIQVHVI